MKVALATIACLALPAAAIQPEGAPGAAGGDATLLLVSLGLLALSLLLLVAEMFIPSGGMLALLTLASALGSVIAMFMWSQLAGLILLAALLLFGPIIVIQGIKMWSRTPIGRRAVLHGEAGGGPMHTAGPQAGPRAEADATAPDAARIAIGSHAVAETPLRPGGFIRFGSARVDAIAEGRFIEAGERVEVVGRIETQWKVRRAEAAERGGTLAP